MRSARLSAALLACALFVTVACGAAAAGARAPAAWARAPAASRPELRGSVTAKAAACPGREPSLSSALGTPPRLVKTAPLATTMCIYAGAHRVASAHWRGGPLDKALNTTVAALPSGTACAAIALLPTLVVLEYAHRTRHVVLYLGGCASLVMRDQRRRFFSQSSEGTLLARYAATAPHPVP